MADTTYNRLGDNSLLTLSSLIKAKIEATKTAIEKEIPEVDAAVTQASNNAVTSAAVYKYVADAVKDISGVEFKVVQSLPTTGESKYIYLVPKTKTAEQDIYDEYIWYNSAWEHIGSTSVDMSGYVKATEMHELTAQEVTAIFNSVWGD